MMEGFHEMVDFCQFSDLGYVGLPYTWDNHQQGIRSIKVRLDRALGDDKFMDHFDNTMVRHLQTTESDHCALLVSIRQPSWLNDGDGHRTFHFENAWTRHENYKEVVEKAWVHYHGDLGSMSEALGIVRSRLQVWSKSEFGFVRKKLKTMGD